MLVQMMQALAMLVGSVLAGTIVLSALTATASPHLARFARFDLRASLIGTILGGAAFYALAIVTSEPVTAGAIVVTALGIGVATERAYWLAHNSSGGGTPPLPPMPYDR